MPISATEDPQPILELDEVTAGYGAMTVLNGLSLRIRRGAITTIIGPNGAGKSTVFKTVFGLLAPRQGRIRFDGTLTTGATPRRLIDLGMCYIPQGRNIFPTLSVRHNLELGAVALTSAAEIGSRIEASIQRFPVLAAKADRQASTLSGGEQKLLEIARGLLTQPKLLLIDEPSIGLSPIMVERIFSILSELRAGGTSILMVEQNARSALQISDDGLVLELGRVRMAASAEALLNDPRVGQLFLGGTSGASAA
ncbi:MAG: ABC transporter ATP-binding protein [Proteobacteria bacterium]|nr:ABC transporter ATP-binding protein [Pseudomonadota bacterium]MBI3498245.1 ABC transporter ATP-binding protein [Pseudomonadota bacterium]